MVVLRVPSGDGSDGAEDLEDWEQVLPAERARLVRLCLQLTGSANCAEDLAQETLYEAWRHAYQLRDPGRRAQWLSGIARNVCRQWRQRRHRDAARRLPVSANSALPEDALADDFDVEAELERAELIRLLDRAMGLLSPDARRVLYERYVAETPQAETALRMGLSAGAVAMKLQRGKLALRRVLSRELRAEATGYGLVLLGDDGWKETSLWCIQCGQRRLLGRWTRSQTFLSLRCPACSTPHDPSTYHTDCDVPGSSNGARSVKPAFLGLIEWLERRYWSRIVDGAMPCLGCDRMVPILTTVPNDAPAAWMAGLRRTELSHMYRRCSRCGVTTHSSLPGRVLDSHEGRGFWREHPRVRLLPERHVDSSGGPAIVTTYESVADSGRFEVVTNRTTLRTLTVAGVPAPAASRAKGAPRS